MVYFLHDDSRSIILFVHESWKKTRNIDIVIVNNYLAIVCVSIVLIVILYSTKELIHGEKDAYPNKHTRNYVSTFLFRMFLSAWCSALTFATGHTPMCDSRFEHILSIPGNILWRFTRKNLEDIFLSNLS